MRPAARSPRHSIGVKPNSIHAAVHESGSGTEQTSRHAPAMSVFAGDSDIQQIASKGRD